jgi:hypothetical protein
MQILTTKHVAAIGAIALVVVVVLYLFESYGPLHSRVHAPPYVAGKIVLGTFKSAQSGVLTLDENIPEVKVAQFALASTSQITKQTLLSADKLKANYDKFKAEQDATTTLVAPPVTGSISAIALADLKPGDYLSVNLSTTTTNGMLTVSSILVLPIKAPDIASPMQASAGR